MENHTITQDGYTGFAEEFVDIDIFEEIAHAETPRVLVTILTVKGSAPRHPGTKMLVRPDGSISGTVGGGEGEILALALSARSFANRRSFILDFEMLGRNPSSTEAICGGVNSMLIEYIENSAACAAAGKIIRLGKRALLARMLERFTDGSVTIKARVAFGMESSAIIAEKSGDYPETGVFAMAGEDSELPDTGQPVSGFDPETVSSSLASGNAYCSKDGSIFYDPVFPEEKLLILGGGHVGRALAGVALTLGFSVTVADDRSGFDPAGRFPEGVRTQSGSFMSVVGRYPVDPSTYIVILTRGHLSDLECLRAILSREYFYAGFIGSARKTSMILEQLESEGFPPDRIQALCAPVGLDIGGETPEEIAIAILAEMIAFRRNSVLLPSCAAGRSVRRSQKGFKVDR